MKAELPKLADALINGDQHEVRRLAADMLNAGLSPEEILQGGLLAGMNEVGRRFKTDEMFVPEVLRSARAMHEGLGILKPVMVLDTEAEAGKKVMIGTVKGDLHDIGKNLVIIMLESAGYQVVDLGINVTPEKFLEAFKAERPDYIGMSAMLTTTMQAMAETITYFQERGQREDVKFVIGGAPVTAEFARKIGADGYAADAAAAVELIREIA